MRGRIPYGALTRGVLGALAVGAGVIVFATFPGLALALKPFLPRYRCHPATIHRTVQRLRARRLIRLRKRHHESVLTLTDAGRQQGRRNALAVLTVTKPARWDGQWRVVVFDIPEEQKVAREALRAKLRHLNFYQLQRSVFVTPYECRDAIEFLKEFYGLDHCVHYLVVSKIDCHEVLRGRFDLTSVRIEI